MKFKHIQARYAVKAGITWPIGEEEYHACLSRKRTPVQVWYGSPYRGECSKAGEAVSKTAWVGSIPNRPCHIPRCSSVGRAPDLGSGGRWFETSHLDHRGEV